MRATELCPSEIEVLRMMCAGKTDKQIAFIRGVSTRTLQHQRASIRQKSRTNTGAQLGVWAVRQGLV